jgi:uncharacterized damage-inducible protein DinB
MEKSDLVLLYAYNRWANARVLEACRRLTWEQLVASIPASFGSLIGTLAHILGAEITWRRRMQEGISPDRMVSARDFSTLEELVALWQEEENKMRAFVESLRDEDLVRWVEYTRTSGEPQGSTLWKALVHLVNHGTQFRGEAGAALAAFGQSPGDLDLILYLRESDQR